MTRLLRRKRLDRGIKVRSDSIYALSSLAELAYLAAPRVLLAGGLLLLPVVLSPWPYWSRVALSAALLGLLGLSFDLLAHHAGLLCLGGAFFYGVGGYLSALAGAQLGLPWFAALPLATVTGAALCTLAIAPCLPLRGIYFAVVTLMYPLLATRLIEAFDIAGGTEGVRGVPGFAGPGVEAYLLIVALLAALFGLRRFLAEDSGLVVRAVKENDQAVRAAGISVAWCRARALFVAAALGCFAGAYYVQMYRGVGVSAFALDHSILPIAATVIGGGGTLAGPVVGGFLLVPLGELLRDFGSLRIAAYALVLTAVVVYRSEGLIPWAARRYEQFEEWSEA